MANIKLIFCGDFFQLPPVVMDGARDRYGIFAYDARCWDAMFPPQNSVTLRRVFRQGDSDFVATLGRLRKGKVSQSDLVTFHECERPLPDVSGVKPVKL
jgi:ATP-dependent DNA helicase PIF1